MFVLATGSPVEGLTLYGVFDTDTAAVEYAVDNLAAGWWLMPVNEVAPTKSKEKKRVPKIQRK